MSRQTVLLAAVFLCVPVTSFAQRRPGSGLNQPQMTSLTVRLAFSNDHPVRGMQLRVELLPGAGSARIKEAFAMDDGRVEFGAVPAGNYRIRVTGEGVTETTSPSFWIDSSERVHNEYVQVRTTGDASSAASSAANASVSAAELKVPDKARKELKKSAESYTKGDLKEALERADKAIEIYPQYAAAHYARGVILTRNSQLDQARQAFESAIAADDHFARAYTQLGRLKLAARQYAAAQELLNKSLTINPQDPQSLTMLADAQFMLGNYAAAIATARRVHNEEHAGMSVIHYIAAQSLERTRHPQEAAAEYELFLKENPTLPAAEKVRQHVEQLRASK